jgi:putative copper resistance protein D
MDNPSWLVLRGVLRGLHIAGSFGVFGTALLCATLLRGRQVRGAGIIVWASLGVALLAGFGWFLLQTGDFASAGDFSEIVAAIPIVAEDTRFGFLLLARLGALVLSAIAFQFGWHRLATIFAAGTVVAESWLGHGGAMGGTEGRILLATSIVHLLAAAAWLGTLPALYLALRRLPAEAAQGLARDYSPRGMACVAALIVTATIQYFVLIGRPAALLDSAYGLTASVKILLLAGLIGLAARNRLRLTPKLPGSRAQMLRSIRLEIVLGLCALIAAGLILQLEPPAMAAMTP